MTAAPIRSVRSGRCACKLLKRRDRAQIYLHVRAHAFEPAGHGLLSDNESTEYHQKFVGKVSRARPCSHAKAQIPYDPNVYERDLFNVSPANSKTASLI